MLGYKSLALLTFLKVNAIHVHESKIVNLVSLFCNGDDSITAKFESEAELNHFTRDCDAAVVEYKRDTTVTPNQYSVSWNPYACAAIPAGSDISKYDIDSQLNFAQTKEIGEGADVFQAIIQPFKFIASCRFKVKYELSTDLGVADMTLADSGEGTFTLSFGITRTHENFVDANPSNMYTPTEMTYHTITHKSAFPFEDLEYVPTSIQVMKAGSDRVVPIFDVEWETCGFEALHFSLDYKNNNWQLAYMAFLLDLDSAETSYTLKVSLSVCKKDDEASVCNKMRRLCATEGTLGYVEAGASADVPADDGTMADDGSMADDGTMANDGSMADDGAMADPVVPTGYQGCEAPNDIIWAEGDACVPIDSLMGHECGSIGDYNYQYAEDLNQKLAFFKASDNPQSLDLCEEFCTNSKIAPVICDDPRLNFEMFRMTDRPDSFDAIFRAFDMAPRLVIDKGIDLPNTFWAHERMFREGMRAFEWNETGGVAGDAVPNAAWIEQYLRDDPLAVCVCTTWIA